MLFKRFIAKHPFPINSYFRYHGGDKKNNVVKMTPVLFAAVDKEDKRVKYTYYYTPFKIRFGLFMGSMNQLRPIFKDALKFLVRDRK